LEVTADWNGVRAYDPQKTRPHSESCEPDAFPGRGDPLREAVPGFITRGDCRDPVPSGRVS